MNIRKTKNYKKFSFVDGNRIINNAHLNQLIQSIKDKDLTHVVPIIVNDKYEIIDGQHRFLACQKLGLPIYYVVEDGCGINAVKHFNTTQKNWEVEDFARCFAEQGDEVGRIALEFHRKWRFNWNEVFSLLANSRSTKGDSIPKFKRGEFKIKNLALANRNAERIIGIKPYYKKYRKRAFVVAMLRIFQIKGYKHKQMIHKMSYQTQRMFDCPTVDEYVRMLQDIYNYKVAEEKKLRFV